MLLLTRKLGEKIRIDDDITVVIVEVKGNNVKLGIDAPPHVKVHREEIYDRIQAEKDRASKEPKCSTACGPGSPKPDDPSPGG